MIDNYSTTTDLKLDLYSEHAVISTWFQLAYRNQMAVALWKLPGKADKHLVIDTRKALSEGKVDLEETEGGFLVAPYQNPFRSREILIKADFYFNSGPNQIMVSDNLEIHHTKNLMDQFKREIRNGHAVPPMCLLENGASSTSSTRYRQVVANALLEIQAGRFQKVVPAVLRQVRLEKEFSGIDTFYRLCSSYPSAFVSLVSAPGIGTWLGASPEALIEVDRSKIFTTVAVAGTQAYHPEISLQEVAWRQKEIEEQALVSRYIINCFKKIRLREFEESGPKTVVAGNLLHLKTTYTINMEETNFPLLGSVMLDLLHPTSAVCGMPKTAAQEFLTANEDFDRELFSGYLGPVNIHEETHLFVNLRCMQIQPKYALLYAGAGVTEDSIPEKEWLETQLKCDTLLEVMNQ